MNWYKRFTCWCMGCKEQEFRWWSSIVNLVMTAMLLPIMVALLLVVTVGGVIPGAILLGIAHLMDFVDSVMLKVIRRNGKEG